MKVKKLPFTTRLVVVDHTALLPGRVLDMAGVDIHVVFQDDDRTLKIFLTDPGQELEE